MDTKKLRQKILDLAIHGKLVPQDPNDEPASVLLERIRAEKERLIAEGKIKRSKRSATSDTSHYENRQVGEANVPFEVPEGWCWTTIGEVASSILYGVSESAKETGAYKLLRITDIQDNKVNWDSVPHTDFDKDKALNYLLQDGDILFARTGATVGKSYLVSGLTEESIYASYLIRVQTSQLIFPEYIKRFFESGYYWEQISLSSVGIGQPNVNGTTLANLNVPIPPYKEQLRIVEETNRWLAIADILDENTGHVCKAIESAKAKILDLAIHGKLVPQDANDEPASVLLERIRAEKERLIAEGKIKRSKRSATSDTSHYENVPEGWVLTDIGELLINRDSERVPLSLGVRSKQENKIYDYYGATGVVDKVDGYLFDERLLLIGEDGANLLSRSKDNAFFAEGKYWVNNHAHILDCPEKEVLDYVSFLINSMSLEDYITGSAQPKLNQDNLNKIEVPLPPLAEQRRIIAQVNLWQRYIQELETSVNGLIEKSLQA